MRNLLYVSALVALGGCMNEEKFQTQLEEKYCDELTACNPDLECEAAPALSDTCEFDKAVAKECLDATFECTDVAGVKMVMLPDVCLTVCGDGEDTDAAATDTDPAT